MGASGLIGHPDEDACWLPGPRAGRFVVFFNAFCFCFFAATIFFVCFLRVEVEDFTGLLVSEEPYPEQNIYG